MQRRARLAGVTQLERTARAVGRRALGVRIVELQFQQPERVHVGDAQNVARRLEDCAVREEGAVCLDGDALENLLHVDGETHVLEGAVLPHVDR